MQTPAEPKQIPRYDIELKGSNVPGLVLKYYNAIKTTVVPLNVNPWPRA